MSAWQHLGAPWWVPQNTWAPWWGPQIAWQIAWQIAGWRSRALADLLHARLISAVVIAAHVFPHITLPVHMRHTVASSYNKNCVPAAALFGAGPLLIICGPVRRGPAPQCSRPPRCAGMMGNTWRPS